MLRYIIRRLLGSIPTFLLMITASFFLIHAAPGSPFDTEKSLPEEIRKEREAEHHLDKPVIVRFAYWGAAAIQGDFGYSLTSIDQTAIEKIASKIPRSAELGILSMIIAMVVGTFIGSIAALRQNSRTDYTIMSFSMVGISLPSFVIGPLMVLVFSIYLGWFNVAGWSSPQDKILPVIALSLPYIAYIARMTRGSMIEVLRSNFVRTAYAKGVPTRLVVFRHVLKPSLLPVASFLGPAMAGILTGSLVVENIFNIPGLGQEFINAARNRDYNIIMAILAFYGLLIIGFNFLVDIIYAWLDPRVRKEFSA